MSNSKMLIDAAHPEETRVVVLKGNRVEEFDFESSSKKQLRGNIYLAKVTRVEPSLQAAFVEYGGNRHGFLAFSEIHPDYYQIPFADRQALLEEEARAHRDEDDEPREARGGEGRSEGRSNNGGRRGGEGRSNGGRNESRGGDNRGSEAREGRVEKDGSGEGRSERSERSERNARGEGRGDRDGRGGRDGRGERGQRRSRRHRRDNAPATALDRRGSADESISEPAFEADEELTTTVDVSGETALASTGLPGAEGEADGETESSAPVTGDAPGKATAEAESAVASGSDEGVRAEASSAVETVPDEADAASMTQPAADQSVTGDPVMGDEPAVDAPAAEVEAGADHAGVTAAAEESYVLQAHADDAPHHDAAHEGQAAPVGEAKDVHAASAAGTPVQTDEAADLSAVGEAAEPEMRGVSTDREPAVEAEVATDQEDEQVEQIGGDALSDVAPRPVRLRRHYKIQEVIKRRQILLIQVVKEERGNKGAALTTYLSLAGRYSVLMPNTAKGGGISRKITDGEDRKRLKAIANELDVPEGMGVILRTAGASRSPIEVKRDFEYLLRMWESVRELTLKSSAPTLVYEEGSLIKRSIRDLYSKDVEEIVVSGEAGYAEARDFMRMLMPGNVKSVLEYRDPSPIFAKSGVEAQLDAMFSAHVTLKSGGYLVINQTEALVAIDVNSGRSTREHNIEDTALRTNMEAADEVARQLRLRDLAGLIVVDFIDMEEGRNNRAVERRIKEALKNDRARIQIGRISHFGLLEMSRQRIRTGVLEGSTVMCPHCAGAGTVRSTSSIALHVLRLIEDALIKDAAYDLVVRSRGEVALYMLNQKRAKLVELEQRFGVTITVEGDPSLTGTVYHAIERGDLATPAEAPMPRQDLVRVDSIAPIFEPELEPEVEEVPDAAVVGLDMGADERADEPDEATEVAATDNGEGGDRRRKRRRRRRGRDRDGAADVSAEPSDEGDEAVSGTGAEMEALRVIGFSAEPSGMDEVGTDSVGAGEIGTADIGTVDMGAENIGAVGIGAVEPVEASLDPSGSPEPAEAAPEEPALAAVQAEPVTETVEAAKPAEVADIAEGTPKRRRSRRTAVRAEEDAVADGEAAAEVPAGAAAEAAPKRRRRSSRARAVEAEADVGSTETVEAAPAAPAAEMAESAMARPSADRDVGADTVEHHVPDAVDHEDTAARLAAPAEAAAEPSTAAADSRAPAAEAAEPQPDRPKRSGWWQRAKAPFGS